MIEMKADLVIYGIFLHSFTLWFPIISLETGENIQTTNYGKSQTTFLLGNILPI